LRRLVDGWTDSARSGSHWRRVPEGELLCGEFVLRRGQALAGAISQADPRRAHHDPGSAGFQSAGRGLLSVGVSHRQDRYQGTREHCVGPLSLDHAEPGRVHHLGSGEPVRLYREPWSCRHLVPAIGQEYGGHLVWVDHGPEGTRARSPAAVRGRASPRTIRCPSGVVPDEAPGLARPIHHRLSPLAWVWRSTRVPLSGWLSAGTVPTGGAGATGSGGPRDRDPDECQTSADHRRAERP